MANGEELIALSARDAVAALAARQVSPGELIDAAEARAAAVDGAVNALVTPCFERARDHAASLAVPDAPGPGWLGGLPSVVKDLVEVAGVRTTYGSPIFADYVPRQNGVTVDMLERNGAIVIGKANTPEFGAGAQTFNEVFGKTRNPWNTALTCGGSSGGSAVALATGMAWLATGSDLGGSLRTPASFCSVVGLRPSPGRVAHGSGALAFGTLSVDGPMGRTVGDVALMLDAMVGHHPGDPISFDAPARPFVAAVDAPAAPGRVGFSRNLGIGPVDGEVADICEAAVARFTDIGAAVDDGCPDLGDAMEIFQTLRAAQFAGGSIELLRAHRAVMKPELIWNIEKGLALNEEEIGRAEVARTALYRRVAAFFDDYDVLACPAAIVPPFDVDQRYVEVVDGYRFDNYIDWIYITYAITLSACPAISVPCGFTAAGLPVGLQLVGRPRGEAALLGAARLFEQATALEPATPIAPRTP